jgi:uncharacterized protein YgiM (DUF1202 family)
MWRKLIFFSSCLIFVSGVCLYAADFIPFKGRINAEDINIRSDSTVSSAVIVTLAKGEEVEVVGQLYDWYKVRLPKTSPSYIFKDLTEPLTENTVVVSGEDVNVRLAPRESAPVLGRTNRGEVLTVLGAQGDWLRIKPINNSFGWVHKMFVSRSFLKDRQQINKASQPAILARDEVSLKGMVRPYGKVIGRTATHKLTTGDYKIYLLQGDPAALAALNYRRARIIGRILEGRKDKYPVVEIHKLELEG